MELIIVFNILKSKSSLPNSFKIFFMERSNLEVRLRTLRKKYLSFGWNVLTLRDKLGLIAIDKKVSDSSPPFLEDCWSEQIEFSEDKFNWSFPVENQNQFIHALFSSFMYNLLKSYPESDFTIASDIGLKFKRDFLKKDPILEMPSHKVYLGLQFIPSLVKNREIYYPSFIVRRITRIKGSIKGSPYHIQNLSKLDTNRYFMELTSFLNDIIGDGVNCNLSSFSFNINNKIEDLKTKHISKLSRNIDYNEYIDEYNEDFPFIEEFEEETDFEIEEEKSESLLEQELIDYILPIVPSRIEYGTIEESPLWVGRNVKKSECATMYLLNQFGPLYSPKYKIVFIPLYPLDQPNIKEKIFKVANLIVFGSGTGQFDFPGLLNRYDLKISLTNATPIDTSLTYQNFKREVIKIIEEIRSEFPNLPLKFKLNETVVPFFIIGLTEDSPREWGKFTPLYQYFKENLTKLGYPTQIIKNFNQFFGKWKTFPLWSVATSIFAKLGGIPWQVEACYTKDDVPIDMIIGYRFARGITENKKDEFILGIATVFTGNGKYLGFKTQTFEIDEIEKAYNFVFRSHGYSRRYEGLKIPNNEVKNLFFDAVKLIDKNDMHQEKPGAVIIHRLGSVSTEEADSFMDCFNTSNFAAGALVSVSEFPLKWNFNNKAVPRGTWINLDDKSGLIFPQGISRYFQGYNYKNFAPKSIPNSFKIKILRDSGVYSKPYEAGFDILALSRMNWRHTTYIPSNFPISLQYSLIIAQYVKNNIFPTGDLSEIPWFL